VTTACHTATPPAGLLLFTPKTAKKITCRNSDVIAAAISRLPLLAPLLLMLN
jgi:hypothetical protein